MREPLYKPEVGMKLWNVDNPTHTAVVVGGVRRGRIGFAKASHYNVRIRDSKGEEYNSLSDPWLPQYLLHMMPKRPDTSLVIWHDCSVRPPDDETTVLAYADGEVHYDYKAGDEWFMSQSDLPIATPTLWAEIPFPPCHDDRVQTK